MRQVPSHENPWSALDKLNNGRAASCVSKNIMHPVAAQGGQAQLFEGVQGLFHVPAGVEYVLLPLGDADYEPVVFFGHLGFGIDERTDRQAFGVHAAGGHGYPDPGEGYTGVPGSPGKRRLVQYVGDHASFAEPLPVDGHHSRTLDRFYTSGAHRVMIYLCLTLFSGLATLLALETYDLFFRARESSLIFRGIYAWETALNFGLCHFIMDELAYRFGQKRIIGSIPAAYRVWLAWFTAFGAFMVLQRTMIYGRTIHYYPKIIAYYNAVPEARPGWLEMTIFCFPFWLCTTFLTVQLIRAAQSRHRGSVDDRNNFDSRKKNTDLVVKSGGRRVGIKTDSISHITVEDHYCGFYIQENGVTNRILALMSLRQALSQLPSDQFLRIHRSHAVRIDAISKMVKKGRSFCVIMKTGDLRLPVSRQRMPLCREVMQRLE